MTFQAVEAFPHQLQSLLSGSYETEQEKAEKLSQETAKFLRETLGEFVTISEVLREMLEDVKYMLDKKVKTPDELWRKRDFRLTETLPSLGKPDLGMSEIRQVLESLDEAPRLLNLLDQIEQQRKIILLYDDEINELILTAWREEHPYFSSSGTLKSDIQSEHLKDLKALDRR